MYIDTANAVKVLNSGHGGDVQVSSINEVAGKDGLHIKVNHKNHGMYWTDNKVEISGVQSDIKPTKLAVAYQFLVILEQYQLMMHLTSQPLRM